MQNCTEANRNKPFPGYIDPDSLIVQDDYVFVQVGKIYFYWLSQRHFPVSVPNAALFAAFSPLIVKKKKTQRNNIIFTTKGTLPCVEASILTEYEVVPFGSVCRTYVHGLTEALLRLLGLSPEWGTIPFIPVMCIPERLLSISGTEQIVSFFPIRRMVSQSASSMTPTFKMEKQVETGSCGVAGGGGRQRKGGD